MKSEEIAAKAERYNRVEREADTLGRVIGIKRLKPSEEQRIIGMTGDLDGVEKRLGDDGNEFPFPKRAPFILTAMVCEIDSIPFTFPKSRGELDAVYDRLDKEGIEAVMKACIRLESSSQTTSEQSQITTNEEAKN